VRVDVIHDAREKLFRVVRVRDDESAGALGKLTQGFLRVGARHTESLAGAALAQQPADSTKEEPRK
jgi:hypothetical protein